jgi:hypothetical protein
MMIRSAEPFSESQLADYAWHCQKGGGKSLSGMGCFVSHLYYSAAGFS